MKTLLLTFLLLSGLLLSLPPQTHAQGTAPATGAYIPCFTVKDNTIVVQTGTKTKPLDKDVTLPNGVRVEPHTQSIVLATGRRVVLKEGDILGLDGEFIHKTPATAAATATPPTPASARGAVKPIVVPAFTYQPAAPVNGKLKGVVELGSSGFNMFIIRVDEQRNWKLEKAEFGNSLVMENVATEEDIRIGLKAYIGKMFDFGVGGNDVHFVVSSGALVSDVTSRIVKSLQSLKYVVTTVTAEREGALGLRAAVPPGFGDKSFMVDMGSGNTKIAWLDNGKPKVVDTYGSKYFQSNVTDAVVAADVKAKAGKVPAKLRGTCFIIGGMPYEMAKAARKDQEPYTVLRAADAYPELTGAKNKAGLNIYQAVAAATGCQQFIFGYETNFTIGYLLSLP